MDAFQTLWQRFHPDAVPVGRTLADNGTWNLTRFALLPNGRDSALSRGEFRSLIDRYNIITTEILRPDSKTWLIVPDRAAPEWAPPEAVDPAARLRLYRLKNRYRLTPRWEYYSADDKAVYTILAGEITWREHGFDRLFLDLYHDRLSNFILMSAETGAVVAPFMAGVYVSQPTPEALMAVVSAYSGWLPVPGQGLLRFNPAQVKPGGFQMSKAAAAALQRSLGN